MTFDPLGEPIKGGLGRREWTDLIESLPGIERPSEMGKATLPLPDEGRVIEIAEELNKRIGMGLLEKDYEQVKKNLLTLGKLDRINHAHVKMLRTQATQNVLTQIYDKCHQVTATIMREDWDLCKEMLSDLEEMKTSLESLPSYVWIENGYKEAKRLLEHAEQRGAEAKEQRSKIAKMKDEQERLALEMMLLEQKQKELFQLEEKTRRDLEREQMHNKANRALLEKENQEEICQLEDRLQYVTKGEREEALKKLATQQRAYEKIWEEMNSDQAQQEEKKLRLLEEYSARTSRLNEQKKALEEQNAALLPRRDEEQTNTWELKRILGNHYLGAEAWEKLGVEAGELPEKKAETVSRVKEMQAKGQNPLLVLDIGMSVEKLEKLCAAQNVRIFNREWGDNEEIRREKCYQESGREKRWLLLPTSDHGVLPGTRDKSYNDQVAHMKQHYAGFEIGGLRELVNVAILSYVQNGEILFSDETLTYARVVEQYEVGDWKGLRITLGRNKKKIDGSISGLFLGNDGLDYFYCGLFGLLAA